MECVLAYLNSLPVDKQARFARRCGTTVGYLRKAVSQNQRLGANIIISMERESAGKITCEQVLPDVDWAYLRGTRRTG